MQHVKCVACLLIPCRIAISTNVPPEMENGQRRFVLSECAPAPTDRGYMDNLWELCQDPEVQRDFFIMLATRDISNFKPMVLPETELRTELEVGSRDCMGCGVVRLRPIF